MNLVIGAMTVAEFQANCLEALEKVDETDEPVFITKDGVPSATLRSMKTKPKSLFGVNS